MRKKYNNFFSVIILFSWFWRLFSPSSAYASCIPYWSEDMEIIGFNIFMGLFFIVWILLIIYLILKTIKSRSLKVLLFFIVITVSFWLFLNIRGYIEYNYIKSPCNDGGSLTPEQIKNFNDIFKK